MLWTTAVVLITLWLLGFVSSYTMGGYIHLLLVVAISVLVLEMITLFISWWGKEGETDANDAKVGVNEQTFS